MAGGPPVIAYERAGVDGTRCVVYIQGRVEELDAETFKMRVPNP
jgi:hypothetical protein